MPPVGAIRHYPWQSATRVAALVKGIGAAFAAAIDSADDADALVAAARAGNLVQAIDKTPPLEDAKVRAAVVAELREGLRERIRAVDLRSRAAVVAVELFASLSAVPSREVDPSLWSRAKAIALRLGLGRRSIRMLFAQLAIAEAGDLGDPAREPHLALAFFSVLLGGEPEARDRNAKELARALVTGGIVQVDAVLWFALAARMPIEALFAKNERRVLEAHLRALLDAPVATPLAMASSVVLPEDRRALLAHSADTWIHVGDAAGALALGIEAKKKLGIGRGLEDLLLVGPGPRLLDAKETKALERAAAKTKTTWKDLELTEAKSFASLRIGRPLLVTDVGRYLGIVRVTDPELRSRVDALGHQGRRWSAMRYLENLLAIAKAGDTFAFVSDETALVMPFGRAARSLQVSIAKGDRLRVDAVDWHERPRVRP